MFDKLICQKKNNEENIQFDRDTSKPEQKLVKKTKKVDGATQTKKEENLQKQNKSGVVQGDKGIQSSSPQVKRQPLASGSGDSPIKI